MPVDFKSLMEAKDTAVAHDQECEAAEQEAQAHLEEVVKDHMESIAAVSDAYRAVHDLLVERGEH